MTTTNEITTAQLLEEIAILAPSVAVEVRWEKDRDADWKDLPDECDPDDFECWQSEVVASAVISGKLVSGSDALCGTWMRYGEHPAKYNPEISGYFPQMLKQALIDLGMQVKCPSVARQILNAINSI
jgi:hypothetical protein